MSWGYEGEEEETNRFVLVLNFFEELKAQIPWLRVFVEGVVIEGKLEN